jgi:hypothetical protein
MAYAQQEVDFERLNMGKFVLYGAGIFSVRGPAPGPLSLQASWRPAAPTDGAAPRAGPHDVPVPAVRHQDAADGAGGRAAGPLGAARAPLGGAQRHLDVAALRQAHARVAGPAQGAAQVARQVVAADGVRGLYRGFTTVVVGVIPARGVRPPGACARRASGRPPDGSPSVAAAAAGPEQPAQPAAAVRRRGGAQGGADLRPGVRHGAACEAGSAGPSGRDGPLAAARTEAPVRAGGRCT